MIKKPSNWEQVQTYSESKKLELDAAVCKVKSVRADLQALVIAYDICEGECANFFQRDFNENTRQDKKWKGVYRIWLPQDDGSERDESRKRQFKGVTTVFEQSNPGYTWDWNEQSLVGRTFGLIYRDEEYEVNGYHGWTKRPFRATTPEKVRNGDYTVPEKKALQNTTTASFEQTPQPVHQPNAPTFSQVEIDELPF